MIYTKDECITGFNFWSGAKENANKLSYQELKELDALLEEIFNEKTPTETEINDIVWFEFKQVCEWLELEEEEVLNRD